MTEIVYTEIEGGYWKTAKFTIESKELLRQCLIQKKFTFDSHHKVKIVSGNEFIKASSIIFPNGIIWDAASSKFI